MPGNGKNVSLSAGKGNEGPILSSALAFGVLIVSFKVLLSKARLVARLLDEEAAMVWSDGAMMVRTGANASFTLVPRLSNVQTNS